MKRIFSHLGALALAAPAAASSCEEMWFVRNLVFDRAGMCFGSPLSARSAEIVAQIKGFEAVTPSGAFYVFPNIAALGMDGFKFCSWLLESAGVSTVPGEVFGMPGHIRMAYCRSYDYIEEGMKRIKKAIESL